MHKALHLKRAQRTALIREANRYLAEPFGNDLGGVAEHIYNLLLADHPQAEPIALSDYAYGIATFVCHPKGIF